VILAVEQAHIQVHTGKPKCPRAVLSRTLPRGGNEVPRHHAADDAVGEVTPNRAQGEIST